MTIRLAIPLSLLLWAGVTSAGADNGWSMVGYPLAGPPQVIGSYAAGCIAGAVALPPMGDGYQVMRPSRNRYYGHPTLIAFVERLGRRTAANGGRLLIGDWGNRAADQCRTAIAAIKAVWMWMSGSCNSRAIGCCREPMSSGSKCRR